MVKRTMDRPGMLVEDGMKLCAWCRAPIRAKSGQRKYCSEGCRIQTDIRVRPGMMRWFIKRRDQEVCQMCGIDMRRLERVLRRLRGSDWPLRAMILRALGFFDAHTLWDADHVVPICEGGDLGPENVRTLCKPCHKAETAKLAGRRAKQKRILSKAERHQERMAAKWQ